MCTKRSRSSNFNKIEELLLLEEINKYKNIIECKTINKLTVNEKEMAWKNILHAFNAQNLQTRTLEQIKSKYDNLKTKARKEVAMLKFNQTGTDGAPSSITLDSSTEATLNIINLKSVVVAENNFDSDSKNDVIIDAEPFKIEPFFAVTEYNNDSKSNAKIVNQDSLTVVTTNNASVVEDEQFHASIPPSHTIFTEQTTRSNSTPEHGWNNCTSHRSKAKKYANLKSQFSNPVMQAKEMYYKRKLEIMEECFLNDCIDRENRNKRKEEKHRKKMILLDLEVEIKRKQLTNM